MINITLPGPHRGHCRGMTTLLGNVLHKQIGVSSLLRSLREQVLLALRGHPSLRTPHKSIEKGMHVRAPSNRTAVGPDPLMERSHAQSCANFRYTWACLCSNAHAWHACLHAGYLPRTGPVEPCSGGAAHRGSSSTIAVSSDPELPPDQQASAITCVQERRACGATAPPQPNHVEAHICMKLHLQHEPA